ncbi:hypothetical protein ACFL6M_02555 [Candidatus Eisenbacteria bacterium]|uniref:Right handed beta helix domain-containing protein n=1 Tax=Eiseniibacteriota bacterium TaxID=2212470 RepID=A0ABV6YJH3_UNCEI
MRTLITVFLVILIFGGSASADTYIVDPEGTGDFATIQDAIDATTDGDVIELTNGTFTGHGNRDIDYLGKAITVRSQSGNAAACIIDCEGSEISPHRGFYFHNTEGSGSVLEEVTVTNGYSLFGGAVYCFEASPQFLGVVFSSNGADLDGGGIFCVSSTLFLSECSFSGNWAGAEGGAVSGDDSSPAASGCSFVSNSAGTRGGAIKYEGVTDPTITDCVFTENWATVHAGAVYITGHTERNAVPTLTDLVFSGNFCGGTGGALVVIFGASVLEGCTFYSNHAADNAGAIWCGGSDAVSVVSNCTLAGNSGGTAGSIYANAHCTMSLENCIIAFGTQGVSVYCADESDVTLSCCDVYGNSGGDWVGCLAWQQGIAGNIHADPLFCGLESGDLTISCYSPCAPDHHPDCGLIGAWSVGCGATAVTTKTWGGIKSMFRQ